MNLIEPPPDAAWRFLVARGVHVAGGIERAFAVLDGHRCIGIVVLHGRDGEAVELSLALDAARAATRRLWRHVVDEALAGASALKVRTTPENGLVREAARLMGASETVIPDGRGDGRDDVVGVVTRRAWRSSRFNRGGAKFDQS